MTHGRRRRRHGAVAIKREAPSASKPPQATTPLGRSRFRAMRGSSEYPADAARGQESPQSRRVKSGRRAKHPFRLRTTTGRAQFNTAP